MAGPSILNADMSTVSRWLRDLLAWWLEELAAMCPPGLIRRLRPRWPIVVWDGQELIAPLGSTTARRVVVQLSGGLALVRWTKMPPMSRRDLAAAVVFEADRLMPLPAAEMLLTLGDLPAPAAEGRSSEIAVAGIVRAELTRVLAALDRAGMVPEALLVAAERQSFDFLRAAYDAGMLTRRLSAARLWWGMVVMLLLLNGATIIYRDIDNVAQLQSFVDARVPIAESVLRAARRAQAGVLVAQSQAERRRRHDPLQALALATSVLPADAWVQKWRWDGHHLRIAGYVRGSLDLVRALRASRRFADVRNAASEEQAAIPTGRPFDILLTLWEV